MKRPLAIFLIAECLAFSPSPVWANTLQPTDVEQMMSLSKRAVDLRADLRQVAQETFDALAQSPSEVTGLGVTQLDTCFVRLQNAAADLGELVHTAMLEAGFSQQMRDKHDEALTLQFLKTSLSSIEEGIANWRKIANDVSGVCRNSALIQSRVQSFLALVSKTENEVGPLARRVTAAAH